VRQGKGQRDRAVYLSETAGLALQAYLAQTPRSPTALAFMYPNGKPLTYAWLYEHLLALGQAADVPNVTPHRLRHTLATRLLNAGMDVTRIQKLLGHEHLDTTMIYARVRDTTVEADYRKAMHYIELGQMPLSNRLVAELGRGDACERHYPIG
jgi:site-specific recombinase XerD